MYKASKRAGPPTPVQGGRAAAPLPAGKLAAWYTLVEVPWHHVTSYHVLSGSRGRPNYSTVHNERRFFQKIVVGVEGGVVECGVRVERCVGTFVFGIVRYLARRNRRSHARVTRAGHMAVALWLHGGRTTSAAQWVHGCSSEPLPLCPLPSRVSGASTIQSLHSLGADHVLC